MHLNGETCLNVICRQKLAGNGQMDLRLMILKKFGPHLDMYITVIFKDLL